MSSTDHHWLRRAIELSRRCPPSPAAYSVGAVVVADDTELAVGWSRDTDRLTHAEESALGKLAVGDHRLPHATLYSALEPCSKRLSRPLPCAQMIIAAGIPRVVIAWREPDLFQTGVDGVELLRTAGIDVVELGDLADEAKAVNAHLWRH